VSFYSGLYENDRRVGGAVSTVGPPGFTYVSEIESRHRILLGFYSIGQVAECSD
jgi:hypothetical protein